MIPSIVVMSMLAAVMSASPPQNASGGDRFAKESAQSAGTAPQTGPKIQQAITPAPLPVPLTPLPGTDDGWVLHIARQGGFTGGVKDNFAFDSLGNVSCAFPNIDCGVRRAVIQAEALLPITSIIMQAKLSLPDAASARNPIFGNCADCVTTVVSLWRRVSGREESYSATWDLTTQGTIPSDIHNLYDAAAAVGRYAAGVNAPSR